MKSPLFSVTADGQLLRGLLAPTSVSLSVLFLWSPHLLVRDRLSHDTKSIHLVVMKCIAETRFVFLPGRDVHTAPRLRCIFCLPPPTPTCGGAVPSSSFIYEVGRDERKIGENDTTIGESCRKDSVNVFLFP